MAVSPKLNGSGRVSTAFNGSASCGVRFEGSGRITPSLRKITSDYLDDAVGRLSISGSATYSWSPTWLLIDTFTGADGTLMNGTACDTGQIRHVEYNNPTIMGNKGLITPDNVGLMNYQLSSTPTRITYEYTSLGTFADLYIYYNPPYTQNNGYVIRFGYTNGIQIIKRSIADFVPWTTGTGAGLVTGGSAALDIYSNGFDLTVDDTFAGHKFLTYRESGMPGLTNRYIALGANGGTFDNLYVR